MMKLETANMFIIYGITAFVFFLIDLLWIGVIAKGFYANFIGSMMGDQINWVAALSFYLIYIGGIVLFVLVPALKNGSGILHVIVMGGLLGFFAYGTFDLTALALFKDWPFIVTVVDMVWGTLLTAASAAATLWIIEPSPRQAAGNLHRKDKKSIFSSLANPAASGEECARYRGSKCSENQLNGRKKTK